MTLALPSSRSTLKARISASRASRSSSLVFRFQMRLDCAWSSWNLWTTEEVVGMGSCKRTCIQIYTVKRRHRPVVEKLPVDFNLYALPSLPKDDWLLVWVLKTNKSTNSDSQYFSLMKTTLHTDGDTRNKIVGTEVYAKVAGRLFKGGNLD